MGLRRLYQITGALAALLAIAGGYYSMKLPWGPRFDFDILGVLWLLGSGVRLAAITLTAFFVGAALFCWTRAARS